MAAHTLISGTLRKIQSESVDEPQYFIVDGCGTKYPINDKIGEMPADGTRVLAQHSSHYGWIIYTESC